MAVRKKIVHDNIIGHIQLEKRSDARRMKLCIKSSELVRVSMPWSVSYESAIEFAKKHSQWIIKHKQVALLNQQKRQERIISIPDIDIEDSIKFLGERLEFLAGNFGYRYNNFTIRNQRTRWGSCSSRNDISLSINIIRLPAPLVDCILLHELVHTRVKNHSKRFWNELASLIPNVKMLDKELNKYDLRLFADALDNQLIREKEYLKNQKAIAKEAHRQKETSVGETTDLYDDFQMLLFE